MAVGDKVAMVIGSQSLTIYPTKGPLIGRIVAEVAGPPVLADVVWEGTGKLTTGIHRDTSLYKFFVSEPTDPVLFNTIAKFMQCAQYPGAQATQNPKSPAAAGIVRRAFGLNPDFTAIVPLTTFVLMSWFDGRMSALIPYTSSLIDPTPAAQFAGNLRETPGRRTILKD